MRIKAVMLSIAAFSAFVSTIAQAGPIYVVNGNFEQVTTTNNTKLGAGNGTTLVGWTSIRNKDATDAGYNFVLDAAHINAGTSALGLKHTNNGFTTSPTGGNFFASDPLWFPGTLQQSISGLTIGTSYTLTFDYALAQQTGNTGANVGDYWKVDFGSATQNTTALTIADGGFSGWKSAAMTFTATSVTQMLSFLAQGSSTGAPPFMLLDNVALNATAVPEPATLSLMLGGVGLVGLFARRRRNKRA
jgi:hypothetical protein